MLLFWLLALAMTAAALLLVVPPLLRGRAAAGRDAPPGDVSRDANVALYRERLAELDRERGLGEIEADRYAALREDLERGLLADVDAAPAAHTATHPPPRWTAAVAVTLAVPACGLAIYLWLGSPHALDPRAQSPRVTAGGIERAQPRDTSGGVETVPDVKAPDVKAMVDSLAAKLAADPADAGGWLLLARSRVVQERFDEAVVAFERAHALLGDDPSLLADWAEAQATLAGNRFPASALGRLDRALEIDPDHEKALWLGGFAAAQHGRAGVAIARWERLLARQPPGSPRAALTADLLARIRGAASAAVAPSAVRPEATGPAEPVGSAGVAESGDPAGAGESAEPTGAADPVDPTGGPRIVVEVSLAPGLAVELDGREPVFVFARAPSGTGPPVAVVRTTVAALPATVVLDASSAMIPSRSLAGIEHALVTARVARSGTVTRTSGDVEGVSEPVAVNGAAPVRIVLSRIVQ